MVKITNILQEICLEPYFFFKNSEIPIFQPIPIFQSIQKVSLFGRRHHRHNHHCCYLSVNNSFPWSM